MEKLKSSLNYGVVFGIVAFLLFVLYYIMDFNPLGPVSWVSAIVPIIGIPFAVKKIRDTEWGGFMSFGEAFRLGMVMSLVWATLFGMLSYIFYAVVDPTILENHIVEQYEAAEEGWQMVEGFIQDEAALKEARAQYDESLLQIKEMTMAQVSMGDVFNKLIGGLIISLIVAGIFKKNRPETEQSIEEAS